MKTSEQGLSLIEANEAYRGVPYKDVAGYWTWGYGHKRADNEPIPTYISQSNAIALLRADIVPVEASINASVTVPLTQNQFDALADFVFNVGVAAFESSTLLRELNSNNYQTAADQLLIWDKAHVNGQIVVVPGLLSRRQHERMLFVTGDPVTTKPVVVPTPQPSAWEGFVDSVKSLFGIK